MVRHVQDVRRGHRAGHRRRVDDLREEVGRDRRVRDRVSDRVEERRIACHLLEANALSLGTRPLFFLLGRLVCCRARSLLRAQLSNRDAAGASSRVCQTPLDGEGSVRVGEHV